MSATNRGSEIISQEFYPTPDYTVDSILSEIDFSKVLSFTEPCRGGGGLSTIRLVAILSIFVSCLRV